MNRYDRRNDWRDSDRFDRGLQRDRSRSQRESSYYGGSRFGNYDDDDRRERFGSEYSDYDRGSYGRGARSYGSTDYDYDEGYSANRESGQPYDSDFGRRSYGGMNYGRGSQYDRDNYGYRYGHSGYGRSSYMDYDDYPESERGYYQGGRGYRDGRDRGWWDRTSDEIQSWFGDEQAERRREMDRREGGHRGRGPSGYKRSDDRIKEDVNDGLTDNSFIDASNINVQAKDGDVTLTGTVTSRYQKRRAEDLAEDVSGVKNVENRLRVEQEDESSSESNKTNRTNMSKSKTAGAGS